MPDQSTIVFSSNVQPALSPASGSASLPPVLDACCGSRMFWFDKADSRAIYVDKRRETHKTHNGPGRQPTIINPDVLCDFRNMPFPNDSFSLVVFDPPHHTMSGTRFRSVKKPGWAMLKYGWLGDDWRDVLKAGFAECFRVLKPNGTLILKWAEKEIAVADILKLTPHKPLFGHRSGKQATTHWIAFLKPNHPDSIPPWRKPPVDVPVQALREFLAQYGPDVSVLVNWTRETGAYELVTIGANVHYADAAVRLRNEIAKNLKIEDMGPVKQDLRGDHPNVSLTLEQIDFMLWLLGYIFAARKSMDQAHHDYISKYHDQLLPVLGDAKERLVNQPA